MGELVRKGLKGREKDMRPVLDMRGEREYAHPFFWSRLTHGPSDLEYAPAITILSVRLDSLWRGKICQ